MQIFDSGYGVADPSTDSGCSQLFASIIIFNRNKQGICSSSVVMFRHVTGVIPYSSCLAVRSVKLFLPSRICPDNITGTVGLGRFLVLVHKLGAKAKCNSGAQKFELSIICIKVQCLYFTTSSCRRNSQQKDCLVFKVLNGFLVKGFTK